jgi:threonine synthase
MGVPLNIHVSTNQNDCVDLLLSKGILDMGQEVRLSAANAMDVGHPYNLERILYLFSDPRTVNKLMDKDRVEVPAELLARIQSVILGSDSVSDQSIYEAVRSCWEKNDYLVRQYTLGILNFLPFDLQIQIIS